MHETEVFEFSCRKVKHNSSFCDVGWAGFQHAPVGHWWWIPWLRQWTTQIWRGIKYFCFCLELHRCSTSTQDGVIYMCPLLFRSQLSSTLPWTSISQLTLVLGSLLSLDAFMWPLLTHWSSISLPRRSSWMRSWALTVGHLDLLNCHELQKWLSHGFQGFLVLKYLLSSEEDEGTNDRTLMYYVNDGVYGSFNCIFFDHAHCLPTLHKVSEI